MALTGSPELGQISLRLDDKTVTKQRVRPGTLRRIVPYAMRYRWQLSVLLLLTVADALITAANPLLLKVIIDDGITPRRLHVVVWLSAAVAGLAVLNASLLTTLAVVSNKVSQGIIFDLRTSLFDHVQRQPLAFFTRTQTGALVSRLNNDVTGAQQAVTSLLSQTVSAVLTLALVLGSMFYLSWQVTLASLLVIPLFVLPGKVIARRLERLSREGMHVDAQLGALANERFNVAGAMLVKLYGRADQESAVFAGRAGRVRNLVATINVHGQLFAIITALITALSAALVYGIGGSLVIDEALEIGTLVALVALLLRLYGPVNQLSSIQINVMTGLVSFDRVFEVLDLQPLVVERPGASSLPVVVTDGSREAAIAPTVVFDRVSFHYPAPADVSLTSLETLPSRDADDEPAWVLRDLSFTAPAGRLTALVGPSGAGKTTISQLVPRLYDPVAGTVRIGGHDVRDLTLRSLHDAVGVVSQDSHMFHDTIRANLLYARPDAAERDLVEACRAARIWDTVDRLPEGLDTVVGDRGYRLSGGEKQRVALARLLLKSPPIVVLDEATAHLDSESEAAIQRALKTALAGRTSLVIAHRLSTIRDADQILVVDEGRIRECGTHEELLAAGGLYTDLHRTQFAGTLG